MQYIQFKDRLKDFTVFSIADARKLEACFDRRRFVEWQEKGHIKKIVRGYYVFSDLKLNDQALFEIANRIYAPSYVSLEMALSFYGLIPEGVYALTSVTTRKTSRFKTPAAPFIYKTMKPELFWGYELIPYQNTKVFKMAGPEKALLDYFYSNPHLKSADDFESLRINKEMLFKQISEERLKTFLKRFAQKALTRRVKLFLEVMKHA